VVAVGNFLSVDVLSSQLFCVDKAPVVAVGNFLSVDVLSSQLHFCLKYLFRKM